MSTTSVRPFATAFAAAAAITLVLCGGLTVANAATTISGATTGPLVASGTIPIAFAAPADASPYMGIASPDGSRVYFGNDASNTLSVIDTATNTELLPKIPLGVTGGPRRMVLSPDGATMYISIFGNNKLVKLDLATNATTLFDVIPGSGSRAVVVSPDGSRLYVADTDGKIEVLNASTGANIATWDISGGAGWLIGDLAINAAGTRLYAPTFANNTVEVINTSTGATVASIGSVGGSTVSVVLSPDGSRLYATGQSDGKAYVINTATNTLLPTSYAVGTTPDDAELSPDGGKLYVSARNSDFLSTVDLASGAITSLATGTGPEGIVVSPNGNTVYVGNMNGTSVSVYSASRLLFTTAANLTPGTASTSVDVTLTDGISPPSGAFTGGNVLVELLDNTNNVVAASTGSHPPLSNNTVSVPVSTAALPLGTYSVRVTFKPAVGADLVANAAGLTVAAALAATGVNTAPTLTLALLLTGLGAAFLIAIRVRNRKISGRSDARP